MSVQCLAPSGLEYPLNTSQPQAFEQGLDRPIVVLEVVGMRCFAVLFPLPSFRDAF